MLWFKSDSDPTKSPESGSSALEEATLSTGRRLRCSTHPAHEDGIAGGMTAEGGGLVKTKDFTQLQILSIIVNPKDYVCVLFQIDQKFVDIFI